MTRIRIGTGPLPFRFDRYFSNFDCVELLDASREPIRLKVLRKLRQRASADFAWSLSAWHWLTDDPLDIRVEVPFGLDRKQVGFFQITEANARLFEEVKLEVEAVQPRFLHFRTPSSFTPTEGNRAAMKAFHERFLADLNVTPVWEARGVWTLDECREVVTPLGWLVASDPYADFKFPDPVAGPGYYFVNGPRGKREFSTEDMEELADFIAGHEEDVVFVFRGPDRERNAVALRRLFPEGIAEFVPWEAKVPLLDDDGEYAEYDDDDDIEEEEEEDQD
jgi:uncharacterized protein YecE (DUF72 family)